LEANTLICKPMNIEMIGVNHRTASIDVREKLSFDKASLEEALIRLKTTPYIREGVILSTCNRVEIYARGFPDKKINGQLHDFLSRFHQVKTEDFQKSIYRFSGVSVVKHLLLVSTSLDSQVLGENQILHQVKEAYFKAKRTKAVSKAFSFLFEEALKIGKKARSQTQISRGAVSISTAAVEMAKKIFEDLSEKKILVIGAGKVGELSASYLRARGAKMVLVANRTFDKARMLAEKFKAKAMTFNEVPEALSAADIVISSVSAPHLLITREMVSKLMPRRRFRPIFFIDLGVPRNIDPKVDTMDNVYVYNIDDLKKVKDANLKERLLEAKKIERIIDGNIVRIESRLRELLTDDL